MGLFDELDIAGAADNPWSVPDNMYALVVSDFEVKKSKKGDTYMNITYKIREGEHADFELVDRKRLPVPSDANPLTGKAAEDAKSYAKMALANLGIPEERMNSVTKEDIIGIECYGATVTNGDFCNIRNGSITLSRPEDVTSESTAKVDPFA